jgi:ADP-ribosylglycohydrolase
MRPGREQAGAGSKQRREEGGGIQNDSFSFEEGLVAVVNLGGDTDTCGAVYGQLAGAHYGLSAIPERWKSKVDFQENILEMSRDCVSKAKE